MVVCTIMCTTYIVSVSILISIVLHDVVSLGGTSISVQIEAHVE
jgi:hypothetical protein